MALTGKLLADFSDFTTAVQQAEVKLRSFETGAGKVQNALQRMTDSFDGRKVIQDATLMEQTFRNLAEKGIGLTRQEMARMGTVAQEAAEKLRAMGQAVPVGIQKIADASKNAAKDTSTFAASLQSVNSVLGAFGVSLSIGAVVQFGRSILNLADNIVRVADRTGLTTTEVQKLQYIAEQSGNSIDDFTGAIGKLQAGLVGGDKGVTAAVKALGLNLEELRTANPYAQMQQIAEAIGKIPDPAVRAALAIELFGRQGAANLPTLIADFKKLGDEAPIMADKTVRALDTAGDSLQRFFSQLKVWAAESYNFVGREFDKMTAVLDDANAKLLRSTATLLEWLPKNLGGFGDLSATIADLRKNADWYNDSAAATRAALGRVDEEVRKVVPAMGDYDALLRDTTRDQKALANAQKRLVESLREFKNSLAIRAMEDYAAAQKAAADQIEQNVRLEFAMNRMYRENAAALGEYTNRSVLFERQWVSIGQLMPDVARNITDSGRALEESFGKKLFDAFDDIDTILTAIPGKLAEIGAIAARTGKAIINNLAEGDVLGAIVAGATGVITAISKIFGKGEIGKVNEMRQAWIDSSGGWEAINKMAQRAGVTLDKVLNARTVKDYQKALKDLEDQYDRVNEAAEKYGLTSNDLFDPNRRQQAFQEELDDLVDTFNDLQRAGYDTNTILARMSKDFVATLQNASKAGVLDPLLEKLVQAGQLTQEMADHLRAVVSAAEPDYKALTEMADKYGITLEQLGPAFQQAHISDAAQIIIDDFNDLIEAGADVNGVMLGMQDEVQDLLDQAFKFGSAIPHAMRPLLEKMVASGLLVDDTGEKLEDLSGINFADSPLEQGISDLEQTIRDLIDAIRGVPSAITDIGKTPIPEVRIPVNFDYADVHIPGVPDRPGDRPGYAGGTHGKYLDFGRGTPVMLHGRERVMTEDEQVQRDGETNARIEALLSEMNARGARADAEMPAMIARHVRDAVQTARRR